MKTKTPIKANYRYWFDTFKQADDFAGKALHIEGISGVFVDPRELSVRLEYSDLRLAGPKIFDICPTHAMESFEFLPVTH